MERIRRMLVGTYQDVPSGVWVWMASLGLLLLFLVMSAIMGIL